MDIDEPIIRSSATAQKFTKPNEQFMDRDYNDYSYNQTLNNGTTFNNDREYKVRKVLNQRKRRAYEIAKLESLFPGGREEFDRHWSPFKIRKGNSDYGTIGSYKGSENGDNSGGHLKY